MIQAENRQQSYWKIKREICKIEKEMSKSFIVFKEQMRENKKEYNKLDIELSEYDSNKKNILYECKSEFWRIDREYNKIRNKMNENLYQKRNELLQIEIEMDEVSWNKTENKWIPTDMDIVESISMRHCYYIEENKIKKDRSEDIFNFMTESV